MCLSVCSKYTTKEELKEAFRRVGFMGGTTYTNEALLKADEELHQLSGHHSYATSVVVVLTDGYSHEDPEPGLCSTVASTVLVVDVVATVKPWYSFFFFFLELQLLLSNHLKKGSDQG